MQGKKRISLNNLGGIGLIIDSITYKKIVEWIEKEIQSNDCSISNY